jgi:signal transduction histidine kinase
LVQSRHSLLVALIVTTVVVTVALSLAGWRLLELQRDSDQQRAQKQREAAAESIAATIRTRLAESGERLSQAATNPLEDLPTIEGGAVLTFRSDGTVNAANLPFVPSVPDTSAVDAIFDAAETLEFARADLAAAVNRYQALARHEDATVRAGALVRLGRAAEKHGRTDVALRAYSQLEQSGAVRFKHLPARFIALYQQHALAKASGDAERERSLRGSLVKGLNSGEWLLTRDTAAWYREQLQIQGRPDTWALAEAIEGVVQGSGAPLPARGQRVFNTSARSILVMWRSSGSTTAMMAAYLDQFLPPPGAEVAWHLADPAGGWLAGDSTLPRGAATPRVVGDSEYAWMLQVGSRGLPDDSRGSDRTIMAMMAAMLVFLWGGMYFMARAIRREAAVARLQSDFVAAVSHEFRTPLTTIRQMTEMLEAGRVMSVERRQAYYNVLTGEATRLQRLVETLLNFGRMEAGAARYQLEEVDLAALIRRVMQDIDPAGKHSARIVASGPAAGPVVHADAGALGLAVRNVIDNALKYSPEGEKVQVEWSEAGGRAAVRVIDTGIGIPPAEQQAIFEKFVRGRSAIDGSVAGTGVGLAMVREIVRAHGGEVDVESEVGRGSTFTVTLPLVNSQLPIANSHLVQEATEARS